MVSSSSGGMKGDGTAYRVGVDVGGTFTDFAMVARGGDADAVTHHKVPSTPGQPAEAIATGLSELLQMNGVAPTEVTFFGHGTTVATNQLIERKGARTALLTTAGFRDVLEIARQTRPHLYDYTQHRPPPLVPRRRRYEVAERIDATGKVLVPLDEEGIKRAAMAMMEDGVEAIAICFLHAYRNDVHEREARSIVASVVPSHVTVCMSSDVLPEFREFERTSTTCANAFLSPRMGEYMSAFLERLGDLGLGCEPYTIHSNGGLMSARTVREFPVRTCLSGPAAGVVGAAAIARAAGFANVVTFDVGGTSTDVSLIANGQPEFRLERSVAGYPVKSPTVDVHVIGAGGGSIGWIDQGGALKVGPQSAGAVPGPAAYGLGGRDPTLTDANLVLRRLNPAGLLGGGLALDAAASATTLTTLGQAVGRDLEGTAAGVVQVAVASIARAIRAVSTERGHNLRDFTLMAYGGGGPVLATAVAREVRCKQVVVPPAPGAMCARGILVSDLTTDYVRTSACSANPEGWEIVQELLADMAEQAAAWFARESVDESARSWRYAVDTRYAGQGFELAIPLERGEPLAEFLARFHTAHEQQYGYALAERGVELVNCRLQAIGHLGTGVDEAPGEADARPSPARPSDRREVYFDDGWHDAPIYDRASLPVGAALDGPAVVEELSSTTLVPPGDTLRVDAWGNLVIEIRG